MNDDRWHHFALTWSGVKNELVILVDGAFRAKITDLGSSREIGSGGTFFIGQMLNSDLTMTDSDVLVGEISRLNVWSDVLSDGKLEIMAKIPGNEHGDLINWEDVITSASSELIIEPSKAERTVNDVNYDIQLRNNEDDHVTVQAKLKKCNRLSACLWAKTAGGPSPFFYSDDFAFGFIPDEKYSPQEFYLLAVRLNNTIVNSTEHVNTVNNNLWHFLCFTWEKNIGRMIFYIDGSFHSSISSDLMMSWITISKPISVGGKNGSFVGTISQLNIWKGCLGEDTIKAMSSGGSNYVGSIFAWSSTQNAMFGNNITKNSPSEIFMPAYSVLKNRTHFCNTNIQTEMFARLGNCSNGMVWACYHSSTMNRIQLTGEPPCYEKNNELLSIS